ncbi:SGNH/GDSL hydrolase family protein [Ancylobacter pratisalsi]|uniref:SGNH/GDSL hydrolase family protein n=2 Tax=Ancylobacter pratisalsi TaxID=1745854 RepID=A0A6P1YSM2_9HYPH|nr:SGNH/GDSL hydrolase family protein [Ancylobacter pratisalsi]
MNTVGLCALLALLLLASPPARAADDMPIACPQTKATQSKLIRPLARTAARLRAGQPVVIVAIGSSSTAGAGASKAEANYPNRLQALLRARFPHADITVVNRGVNGQDAPEMLKRFDTDVAALKPTLVLWQAGVNALFRENGLARAGDLLHEAIARVRAIDADIVLIDPQYAPRVLGDADSGPMVKLMDDIAREDGVDVYHRFALMRDWHESAGLPFESFLWKDKFHMNDWSYDCFSRDLGRAVTANIDSQQRSADVSPGVSMPVTLSQPAAPDRLLGAMVQP